MSHSGVGEAGGGVVGVDSVEEEDVHFYGATAVLGLPVVRGGAVRLLRTWRDARGCGILEIIRSNYIFVQLDNNCEISPNFLQKIPGLIKQSRLSVCPYFHPQNPLLGCAFGSQHPLLVLPWNWNIYGSILRAAQGS